jgi:hypothetical protein
MEGVSVHWTVLTLGLLAFAGGIAGLLAGATWCAAVAIAGFVAAMRATPSRRVS